MERRISLKSLNPHISCHICNGYLIDATAITECLHTFCKSCIVKCMEDCNTCPKCDVVIHRSNPLLGLRPDRTLQDIVYKLVPNLQCKEMIRENTFCQLKGIPYPKKQIGSANSKHMQLVESQIKTVDALGDDQVCIQLEAKTDELSPLKRKYICCSSRTTVMHLKKLIAKKLFCDLDKYCSVDILCKDEVLGKDHTVKFIYVTRWRFEKPPLKLYYKPHIDIFEKGA